MKPVFYKILFEQDIIFVNVFCLNYMPQIVLLLFQIKLARLTT